MKKGLFFVFFFLFSGMAAFFNALGFLCDKVFFRKAKKQEIKPPLFITGMPRSATSFLFQLLERDSQRFTAMKLWEILFAPSITQKKFFVWIMKSDRLLKRRFLEYLKRKEKKWFSRYEAIHPISLFQAEEDEFVLLHIFSVSLMVFVFPHWKRMHALADFDEKIPEKQKQRIMNFYRKCIRNHLFVFGKDKIYLSKSPSHTCKMHTISHNFPGCNFVFMIRRPEFTLSSAISMYEMYNRVFFTRATTTKLIEFTFQMADRWFAILFRWLENENKQQLNVLRFEDLTISPLKTVLELYGRLNFEPNETFHQILSEAEEVSGKYKSSHRHSPESYGLSVPEIRTRYRSIYEYYYPFDG